MKHLCLDARMLFSSGIGTYLRNLLRGWENHPEFEISLLLLARDREYATSHQKILFDVPIYSVKEQLLFPKVIPESDLFWSPHFNVPLRKIKAKKRIVTIHDTYHLAFFSSLSLLQKLYAKLLYTKAVKLSEKIFTVSQFSKLEIIKYLKISEEKIKVIPLGVDQRLFCLKRQKKLFSYPYLLYVGNLKPNKNVSLLLQAFLQIAEKFPSLEVKIVSNSPRFEQKALLASVNITKPSLLERITFYSGIKDEELTSFYEQAEAFVFPSYYEGFGFPPLEAMSLGCPVLAAKAASIPEVCGEAALYFDPYSVLSLVSCFQKLQEKTVRNELIEKGKRQAQKYGWQKTVKEHERVLYQVLQEKL